MGWQWEARVVERFCRYQVNGAQGWGVSEWHWKQHEGRPSELEASDPDYTKGVKKYPH